ncbi:T9SS type A sorting domain-containing protein [Crocinitomix algicola]|uniref:T9SS type A sorting domain-containing protein n=1 Tax=Crocinitomix algicola TaxID=1740263 RepID=UPI000833A176|nr:T9SS type A sorting domain-containing protein [Crocinitomix algicola]
MNKSSFLVLLITLISHLAFSQTIDIEWQKSVGGESIDSPRSLLLLNNGTLLTIGHSYSTDTGNKTSESFGEGDLWVVNTNEEGEIIWQKAYGGINDDGTGASAIEYNDRIYILTSSYSGISGNKTTSNFGESDFWLLCIDQEGNLLWDKTYGGAENDRSANILLNSDNNFILSGNSSSNTSGNKTDDVGGLTDYWVLEVSSENGDIINQKSVGSNGFELLTDVVIDETNNIYLIGNSLGDTGKDKTMDNYGLGDIWIVKLNADFNIVQDKAFGGTSPEYHEGDVKFYKDFLYVLVDSESSESGNKTTENYGSRDSWLLKLNKDLTIVWEKNFGGYSYESSSSVVFHPTTDQIILSIKSKSIASGNKTIDNYDLSDDVWLLVLDKNGEIVHQKVIGGNADDIGYIVLDNFNNIYLSAFSNSGFSADKTEPNYGFSDYWIVKLNAGDFLSSENYIQNSSFLDIYPNPFNDELTLSFSTEITDPVFISINDVNGRVVISQELKPTIYPGQINTEKLSPGVYFYSITSGKKQQSGKIIKR